MLPILIIGGLVAAGAYAASRWNSDNDADEEELERMRAQRSRILRLRRSRIEKDKRRKAIQIELVARKKELKLIERADELAKRQLACGNREFEQFNKELVAANRASVRLPEKCVQLILDELRDKTKGILSVHKKCLRHAAEVRRRIKELNSKRFYFRCVSCRRKFAVAFGDLDRFNKSRKGVRKCCDDCLPHLKARARKRAAAK